MNRSTWIVRAVACLALAVIVGSAMRFYTSPFTAVLLADAWLLCAGQ